MRTEMKTHCEISDVPEPKTRRNSNLHHATRLQQAVTA
ncbi:hypothetical protein PGR6_34360 [Pseudomonas sp. GR 6-02]|nr:hypothetical protein PGR6_34360 [Pseudomonas sp. GR 6-02]